MTFKINISRENLKENSFSSFEYEKTSLEENEVNLNKINKFLYEFYIDREENNVGKSK